SQEHMSDTTDAASGARGGSRQPGGSLVVRLDGTIVSAERHAAALLGAPDAEALAGRDWSSLVSYTEAGALLAARRALEGGDGWSGALRYRYAHGEVVRRTTVASVPRAIDLAVVTLEPVSRGGVGRTPAPPRERSAARADASRTEQSGSETHSVEETPS